ncbi:wax ester synthase-like acyl-CoA acyltransferase domain-containing protein [Hyaloraphidium curvatum]|nr:wax ester synthase-like acyl-CoA acyltransferase domain-containing protein [Hyaloraphidium curvatum]
MKPSREYLSGNDILFGGVGSPNRDYIAGGGLSFFDPPFDAKLVNPDSLREFLRTSRNYGRWLKRLYPDGDNSTFWRRPFFSAEGVDFNIDNHFEVIDLKEPTRACFLETVSEIMSKPLDLNYPPWRCYFLRGLEGGSCAFLDRIQHALSDGEGHLRNTMSGSPPGGKAADSEASAAKQYRIRRQSIIPVDTVGSIMKFLGMLWAYISGIFISIWFSVFVVPFKVSSRRKSLWFTDSRSLNRSKQYACSTKAGLIKLDTIKDLKNSLGTSLNDVILTASTAAIETFLKERGGLLDKHTYWALPTSFRMPNDNALTNKLLYYTLVAPDSNKALTPTQRAKEITGWMSWQKRMRTTAQMAIWAMNTFLKAPWLLPLSLSEAIVAQSHGGISNIPGPATPLYFAGAPISRISVVNPIAHAAPGQLGVAVLSYCGYFSFGVMMEQDESTPWFRKGSAERIVELFEEEMRKLVDAVKLMPDTAGTKKRK